MKKFRWSELKNQRVKRTRGVSFEEIIQSELIKTKKHPTKEHQNVLLFRHKGYLWIVPFVENKEEVFLKTLYPSRKYTKKYRKGEVL